MVLTFTCLIQKIGCRLGKKNKALWAFVVFLPILCSSAKAEYITDSGGNKKPTIVTSLEECRIPSSMISNIKRLSPADMRWLNEEYQQSFIAEDGTEMLLTVKLRFFEDHITGYIKQAPVDNSVKWQSISYIDIPVEWMCIPPKQDHPYHFSGAIAGLDALKTENGCLSWVQRDSDVRVHFGVPKTNKKTKPAKKMPARNN